MYRRSSPRVGRKLPDLGTGHQGPRSRRSLKPASCDVNEKSLSRFVRNVLSHRIIVGETQIVLRGSSHKRPGSKNDDEEIMPSSKRPHLFVTKTTPHAFLRLPYPVSGDASRKIKRGLKVLRRGLEKRMTSSARVGRQIRARTQTLRVSKT